MARRGSPQRIFSAASSAGRPSVRRIQKMNDSAAVVSGFERHVDRQQAGPVGFADLLAFEKSVHVIRSSRRVMRRPPAGILHPETAAFELTKG